MMISSAYAGLGVPIPTSPVEFMTMMFELPETLLNTATFEPCMILAGSPGATSRLLLETVFVPARTP